MSSTMLPLACYVERALRSRCHTHMFQSHIQAQLYAIEDQMIIDVGGQRGKT